MREPASCDVTRSVSSFTCSLTAGTSRTRTGCTFCSGPLAKWNGVRRLARRRSRTLVCLCQFAWRVRAPQSRFPQLPRLPSSGRDACLGFRTVWVVALPDCFAEQGDYLPKDLCRRFVFGLLVPLRRRQPTNTRGVPQVVSFWWLTRGSFAATVWGASGGERSRGRQVAIYFCRAPSRAHFLVKAYLHVRGQRRGPLRHAIED
ncbi:hypothetical protein MRX96_010036 [Rhipicephalus microplus]